MIDSLGWCGEAASLPLVSPLLKDPQPKIAVTAPAALDRLATPAAAAVFPQAQHDAGPALKPEVLEALLRAATPSRSSSRWQAFEDSQV